MTPELVCVGLATRDQIVDLPRWPDPDGRLVVPAVCRAGGGPAATAAVAAARIGSRVAFVGAVGDDGDGAWVRQGLADEGVDVAMLGERPGRTAESIILLDRATASRSILHAPGVALDSLSGEALSRCRAAAWVHVDHAGWPLARAIPRERLSVDAGNPIPDLQLAGLGLYAPTEAALRARYPGEDLGPAVRAALAEGALRVAVTLGSAGAVAADVTGGWRVAGVRTETASTLGAGDVFHGALLAGLLEGLDLPAALRSANLAAALSCRGLDGREAIPTRVELQAALRDAPPVERFVLEPR